MVRHTRTWMALAFLTGALVACDTGTGPGSLAEFDAEAALEDYRTLDRVLGSEGWKGFLAMGGAVSLETFGPAVEIALSAPRDLRGLRDGSGARALATRLLAAGARPHAAAAPVISPQNRGTTFVYDATLDRYVADPQRAGAPADGVRFIVYRERSGGRPDPAQEIGHADLIDEGDGSSVDIALRLVVVQGDRTVLDYRTTLDENGADGSITVSGFVRDDNDRLDFDIAARGSERPDRSALDVEFSMGVDNRDFEIVGAVSGAEEGRSESGDIDVQVRHGRESLRVDLTGTGTSISGTVHLNGDTFATVGGDPDAPTFTSGDGDPLTHPELLVLYRVVDVVEDVFDLFEDLLDPLDEIVLLAVIL